MLLFVPGLEAAVYFLGSGARRAGEDRSVRGRNRRARGRCHRGVTAGQSWGCQPVAAPRDCSASPVGESGA